MLYPIELRGRIQRFVENAPDYAEGWNRRATLLYQMGTFDESVADIDKVLALEPRHFGALLGLGTILQLTGDVEGALQAYRKALSETA